MDREHVNQLKYLLYQHKDAKEIKYLLANLSTPNIKQNSQNFDRLLEILKYDDSSRNALLDILFANIPNLLSYFNFIGDNPLFWNRHNLKKITIPKEIERLGWRSFGHCIYLTEVDFEKDSNLIEIDNYAFDDNPCLEKLDLSNTKIDTVGRWEIKSVEDLYLPNTVKTIDWLYAVEKIYFPTVNSVEDLDLEWNKVATSSKTRWKPTIEIITKTNSDTVYLNDGILYFDHFGPKLEKANIRII